MIPRDVIQWHAALNDFPAILFLLSVAFDVAGSATKRDSLKAAGFWTLVAGVAGAVLALVTGLRAEDLIEHGGDAHELMERHETLGIALTVFFGGLAAWRVWRRGTLGPTERPTYLVMATVGALFTVWTAHLGGRLVYEHGAGVTSEVMQRALDERAEGHEHAPGEEHDQPPADTTMARDTAAPHQDPPGTPPHEHD